MVPGGILRGLVSAEFIHAGAVKTKRTVFLSGSIERKKTAPAQHVFDVIRGVGGAGGNGKYLRARIPILGIFDDVRHSEKDLKINFSFSKNENEKS